MPSASDRRSPLTLVVLALLAEQPMHPYRMFQLIQQRGKTTIVNIAQRNSLYQVIERLVRTGLAEVVGSERADNRPERTVYRITPSGRETVVEWVREMLSADRAEFPAFPAALSLLMLLPPQQAIAALRGRRDTLSAQQNAAEIDIAGAVEMGLPSLFLLDDQYRIAMLEAEVRWLDGLLLEFESGALTWSEEWIAQVASQFNPAE